MLIMKRTVAILAFFVAAVLAGLFVSNTLAAASPATKEKFIQQEKGMPVADSAVSGFGENGPLLGSTPATVLAQPYETANDNELYQFEHNKVGADCCPSPFSGDLGCICLTADQRKEFASRGGNRAA